MAKNVYLNLSEVKFAFLTNNRRVSNIKVIKDSIKKTGRILVPIIAAYAKDIEDGTVKFYDPTNPELIIKPTSKTIVVLDGQHRVVASLTANKEYNEDVKQDKALLDYRIKTIPCYLYDKEDLSALGLSTNKLISEINSTMKNWNAKDYCENLATRKPTDQVAQTIGAFTNLGFSISAISRYITFTPNKINPKSVSDYTNEDKTIDRCEWERGIKLYLGLRKIGFSNDVLKKRYIIDYLSNIREADREITAKKLSSLTQVAIDSCMKYKEKALIEELIKQMESHYKKDLEDGCVKNTFDTISTDQINSFILDEGWKDYLPNKGKKAQPKEEEPQPKVKCDTPEEQEVYDKCERELPPCKYTEEDEVDELTASTISNQMVLKPKGSVSINGDKEVLSASVVNA